MPTPTPAELILTAVIAAIAAIDGIEAAEEVEDRDVPPEIRDGPVVVAYWRASPQTKAETGMGADIVEEWELRVYVPLVEPTKAQRDLYQAKEAVLSVARSESLLQTLTALGNVYAGTLEITDAGDYPEVEFEEHWMMKALVLRVARYAPGVA